MIENIQEVDVEPRMENTQYAIERESCFLFVLIPSIVIVVAFFAGFFVAKWFGGS